MLRFLKISFGLVALLLIVLISIPFFVNINDFKPEIKQAVFDATGRNLEIENIKLSLFPWVGITLSGVQLENAQGFAPQHMLEVDSIDVQVALLPLFDQQIEVKRFELNSPKIWLTQNHDGTSNWSGLNQEQASPTTTTQSQAPATSQQHTLPIAFEAKLLQLSQGQLVWHEQGKGEVVIDDIQLNITDLQLKQPISVDVSANIGGNPLSIKGQIGPIVDLNKLQIHTLPVSIRVQAYDFNLQPFAGWLPELHQEQEQYMGKLADLKVSLDVFAEQHQDKTLLSSGTLTVAGKHTLKTAWKLHLQAMKTLNIESLNLAINNTDVASLTAKIRNLHKEKPKFEAKVTTNTLQRIWLNRFIPALQDIYKVHPKPWESIKIKAFLAGNPDIVEIHNMQLTLNQEPVQVSGDMMLGGAPDIQLRVTANELHLDPWIPQSKKEAVQPSSSNTAPNPSPAQEPNLTFLKPWYLSVQLQAKAIHVMNLSLENLRMTLSSEQGVVRLNPLSFDINGGHIHKRLTLYANRYPAAWTSSIKMKSVSIQPILQALVDFRQLSGIATLNADLSGKGLLPDNIIKNTSGRGNFLFENGQFEGVDIAKAVRKLKQGDTSSKQSDFAQMQGSFFIKQATITNNDLYMASPLLRLTGKGKVFLDPPSIDYHVRPRLIKSLEGQGGSINQKGVVVPLHIHGTFEDIQVDIKMDKDALLDSAGALNNAAGKPIGGVGGKVLEQGFVKTRDEQIAKAKAEAKRKADAEKARLEAEAKRKAEEKLKNMFKGFNF